ncbi:unnamed protein product [Closterium sp. Naga37s-1]|nr:unnamed protein product [Closterium sp. Naga37s-1]
MEALQGTTSVPAPAQGAASGTSASPQVGVSLSPMPSPPHHLPYSSPPGYYFRPGTGSGRRKWHIYLPGGGWCLTVAECIERADTNFGSTRGYPKHPSGRAWFGGILSAHETVNPVFHNWNLVRLVYCDGGGYAGTRGRIKLTSSYSGLNTTATASKAVRLAVATNVSFEAAGSTESTKSTGLTNSTDPAKSTESTKSTESKLSLHSAIYLDGWNIVQAVLQDLQHHRGFGAAAQILLSGSSAGGQATANLCDWMASSFPSVSTRCLVDSGFFLDTRDRFARRTFRAVARKLTWLHRPLNPTCSYAARRSEQWKCFFLQHTLLDISTPIFLFHTPFDYAAAMIGPTRRVQRGNAKLFSGQRGLFTIK